MWRTSACDASIFLGAFWVSNSRMSLRHDWVCWDSVFPLELHGWRELSAIFWTSFQTLVNWQIGVFLWVSFPHSWAASLCEGLRPIHEQVLQLSLRCWWQSTISHLTVSNRAALPGLCKVCWSPRACFWISSIPVMRKGSRHRIQHASTHYFLSSKGSRQNRLTRGDEGGWTPLSTTQERLGERLWQRLLTRMAARIAWKSWLKNNQGHTLPSMNLDGKLHQTEEPACKHPTNPNT